MFAASYGHKGTLESLLANGASIEAKDRVSISMAETLSYHKSLQNTCRSILLNSMICSLQFYIKSVPRPSGNLASAPVVNIIIVAGLE